MSFMRAAALMRWIQSLRMSRFLLRRSRYWYCMEWRLCSFMPRRVREEVP